MKGRYWFEVSMEGSRGWPVSWRVGDWAFGKDFGTWGVLLLAFPPYHTYMLSSYLLMEFYE